MNEYAKLLAAVAGNPVLTELVELHAPQVGPPPWSDSSFCEDTCLGCTIGGGPPPLWPCRTIDVIAKHMKALLS